MHTKPWSNATVLLGALCSLHLTSDACQSIAQMASTSVATPPSSPRKSSFSSLRLSPIKKNLSLMKRREDGDAVNLVLGNDHDTAQSGSSAKDGGGGEDVQRREEVVGGAKEKVGSLRIKRKANNADLLEGNEEAYSKARDIDKETANPTPNSVGNTTDVQSTQNPQEKSPPAPRRLLRFAHVADLFIKLRRAQRRAAVSALHFQRNALVVESHSGEDPVTHAGMASLLKNDFFESADEVQDEGASPNNGLVPSASLKEPVTGLKRRARVELVDTFICADGVDASKLLRASRALLYERAEGLLGVCVFVEESWTCSVYTHRHRHECAYRVQVRYSAISASPFTATQSPHSPTRSAFPPSLPSISEGAEQTSTPDTTPSKSPPASPSRKGKKRLSFTGSKSEAKTNAPGSSQGSRAPPSSPPKSSVAATDPTSTPSTSPTSPTFPSSSPGKPPRSPPKNRSVSFAQPSVLSAVIADVRQPVQLDRARGVPGLMTIVSRETIEFVVAPVHLL